MKRPQDISRRQSLALSLGAASVAIDFGTRLGSAAEKGDRPSEWPNFSFIIVTDTHLGHKKSDGAERQWKKTAPELAKAPGEFVLHLGDVVDAGQEPQYAIYKGVRDTVGKLFYEIPGNHDPGELFEKNLGVRADRSFDHGGVRFILFNNSHTDSHEGFVTVDQLAWLEKECAGAAEKNLWIVFCAHVPFHHNVHPDRGWFVKPAEGQTAFYELAARHRSRVLAAFHGHFHNGVRGWDDRAPLHELCFPSALYNQNRNLEAQGAPGYNLAEFRAGYTLARFADGGKLELVYRATGMTDSEKPAAKNLTYFQG
jgi:3',5'-cyclic AMP phosphodiesterase CpdA